MSASRGARGLSSRRLARGAALAAVLVSTACQTRPGTEEESADTRRGDAPVASADTGAAPAGDQLEPATGEVAGRDSAPSPGAEPRPKPVDRPAKGRVSDATPPGTAADRPAPAPGDSVRGIVRVVGSAPFLRVVLSPAGGGPSLTLVGSDTAALRRASGLEIVARGTRSTRELRVASFAVRSADGQPAVDGVVAVEGASVVLETADGRVPLGNPPAALRDMAGSRVWISGPLDTGPNSYGVLEPRR